MLKCINNVQKHYLYIVHGTFYLIHFSCVSIFFLNVYTCFRTFREHSKVILLYNVCEIIQWNVCITKNFFS